MTFTFTNAIELTPAQRLTPPGVAVKRQGLSHVLEAWPSNAWNKVAYILDLRFCARVKLNFKRLELQLSHPWVVARSAASRTAKVVVIELVGADGTLGLGEAAPTARYKESADTVEAFL